MFIEDIEENIVLFHKTFSSSIDRQTDYGNKSKPFSTWKYLLIIIMFFVYICYYDSVFSNRIIENIHSKI